MFVTTSRVDHEREYVYESHPDLAGSKSRGSATRHLCRILVKTTYIIISIRGTVLHSRASAAVESQAHVRRERTEHRRDYQLYLPEATQEERPPREERQHRESAQTGVGDGECQAPCSAVPEHVAEVLCVSRAKYEQEIEQLCVSQSSASGDEGLICQMREGR